MNKWIIGLCIGATQAFAVHAEPVLFANNVLTLGDAIVLDGKSTRFYQQVQLGLTQSGDFKVLSGVEKNLATVTEKSVRVIATDPPQVELVVSGYMANPCIELETAVTRKGDKFYAVFGETPLQTLVACAQVIEPFTSTLALDVQDLASGAYTVQVNGQEISFSF